MGPPWVASGRKRLSEFPRAGAERQALCEPPTFLCFEPREFRIGQNVRDVNGSAFQNGSPGNRPAVELIHRKSLPVLAISRWKPENAITSKRSSLTRDMFALSARQSRAADSTSVSSTACRSKVERLMTLSTSAVAVCCCSDSRNSSSRRVIAHRPRSCQGNAVSRRRRKHRRGLGRWCQCGADRRRIIHGCITQSGCRMLHEFGSAPGRRVPY